MILPLCTYRAFLITNKLVYILPLSQFLRSKLVLTCFKGAEMVFCILLGCGNRSERNTGTYSSIPIGYHSNMKVNLSDSELENVVVDCG